MNVSAIDENGKPIDWWFAYKVPKMSQSAKTENAIGYEYLYYDAKVGTLSRSPNLLTDGKGALDLTLASVFTKPDPTTGWILYNDEMPADAKHPDDGQLGHTKGVIAFDTKSKTAFWLLHSWPKFSDPHSSRMPTPIYGQTYICLSLDIATASQIAAQMASHQQPQVYFPRVPDSLDKKDPLYLLTQTINSNVTGDSNVIDGKTAGGLAFKVIAKNKKWGKDFWNDLVGPTLKADMDVETWIRGKIPPVLDSDGVHKTFDVKYIDLSKLGIGWTWPETHDHAKWGLTIQDHWVCVGDINRMISQEKRGGGTIAFQDDKLWSALAKTDFVIAPPGHTRAEARDLIKATHTFEHPSLPGAVQRPAAAQRPVAAAPSAAVTAPAAAAPIPAAAAPAARPAAAAAAPPAGATLVKAAPRKGNGQKGNGDNVKAAGHKAAKSKSAAHKPMAHVTAAALRSKKTAAHTARGKRS